PTYPERVASHNSDADGSATRTSRRIENATDHQRCDLVIEVRPVSKVIRLPPPGDAQILHVLLVNLIERRVLRTCSIGAVVSPLTASRLRTGLPCHRNRCSEGECGLQQSPVAEI